MNDARESAKAPSQKKSFDHILGQHYTVFDGLAGMHVEDIYQDRRGLLWIATADGGVSRFDGVHFDTFGLSNGMPHLTVICPRHLRAALDRLSLCWDRTRYRLL